MVKVWRVHVQTEADGTESLDLVNVHSFSPFAGGAVTAVDVCKSGPLDRVALIPVAGAETASPTAWLVALGAETGDLHVWRITLREVEGSMVEYDSHVLLAVSEAHAHGATVRRLRWRPQLSETEDASCASWDLASCGEDRTVRVHRIAVTNH